MASKAPALLVGVSVLVSAILLGALFYRFHGIPNTLEDGFDAFAVNSNDDAMADYLVVRSVISVPAAGKYRVDADLLSGETGVSSTRGNVDLPKGRTVLTVAFRGGSPPQFLSPGRHTITASLEGQDLYAAGLRGGFPILVNIFTTPNGHYCPGPYQAITNAPPEDGARLGLVRPYVMPEQPIRQLGFEQTVTVAYDFDDFTPMELPADFLGGVTSSGYDADGDGAFDGLQVTADVVVRRQGAFDLSGAPYARGGGDVNMVQGTRSTTYVGGAVVSTTWERLLLNPGNTRVTLTFPGAEIMAAGISGPYEAKLRLVPATIVYDPVIVHVTTDYAVDAFEASGAKAVRVSSLALEDGLATVALSGSASLLLRVIHENGIVTYESAGGGGGWVTAPSSIRVTFGVRGEYTVAAYILQNGQPVDYREIVVEN